MHRIPLTGLVRIPALALLVAAGTALADTVEVDGTALEGTIDAVGADGITFTPAFGKGSLAIPYADIDALASDGPFVVLHGEDGEAAGRIVGVDTGSLLVGDDAAGATRIGTDTIVSGYATDGSISRLQQLRNKWRYWTAAFDAAFAVTSGTTDTSNTALGLRAERRKPGTRYLFGTSYLMGTEKKKGSERSTLTNEVHGNTKAEYDLTPRIFVLGAFDAEYDEIERLSYRLVPKAGLGYRLYKTETAFFQLESAPAYLGERFFGGATNDAFALSFGAEGEYLLPWDAVLAGRAEYLPAVDDWADDYLLRSEISLTMPLVGFLNFRAMLADQYDNTPAPGTERNELQTSLGLSVVF